jgi:hypothetical protein
VTHGRLHFPPLERSQPWTADQIELHYLYKRLREC